MARQERRIKHLRSRIPEQNPPVTASSCQEPFVLRREVQRCDPAFTVTNDRTGQDMRVGLERGEEMRGEERR
eukprot:682308-Hanusia_phi.AAC.3